MCLWKYIIVTQQKLYLIEWFLFKYSTFQSILQLNNFVVRQLLSSKASTESVKMPLMINKD